jgi:hypothetical protein
MVLPPGAETIAGSNFCRHTILAIEDRVLGIQAHIEQPLPFMRRIIAYLSPNLPPAVQDEALASLEQGQPDAGLVARWVVNFLHS